MARRDSADSQDISEAIADGMRPFADGFMQTDSERAAARISPSPFKRKRSASEEARELAALFDEAKIKSKTPSPPPTTPSPLSSGSRTSPSMDLSSEEEGSDAKQDAKEEEEDLSGLAQPERVSPQKNAETELNPISALTDSVPNVHLFELIISLEHRPMRQKMLDALRTTFMIADRDPKADTMTTSNIGTQLMENESGQGIGGVSGHEQKTASNYKALENLLGSIDAAIDVLSKQVEHKGKGKDKAAQQNVARLNATISTLQELRSYFDGLKEIYRFGLSGIKNSAKRARVQPLLDLEAIPPFPADWSGPSGPAGQAVSTFNQPRHITTPQGKVVLRGIEGTPPNKENATSFPAGVNLLRKVLDAAKQRNDVPAMRAVLDAHAEKLKVAERIVSAADKDAKQLSSFSAASSSGPQLLPPPRSIQQVQDRAKQAAAASGLPPLRLGPGLLKSGGNGAS